MQSTQSFRSKVFQMAHELFKAGTNSFRVCLSRAWSMYRLKKQMRTGNVKFTFKKVDGSFRRAVGTLLITSNNAATSSRKPNYTTFKYYDLEKQSFRSFKIENLITIF